MFKMPEFINLDEYDEVCRTCGDYGEFSSLHDRNSENLTFADMIMECTSVKINYNDGFPEKICFHCVTLVKQAYAFKRRCEELDQLFHLNGIQTIDVKPVIIEYKVKDELLEELNQKSTTSDDLDSIIEIPSPLEIEMVKEELQSPKITGECGVKPKKRKVVLINCRICYKRIRAQTERQHMKTHSSERPYKCNVCEKDFSYAYNLKRHMMAHNDERPHICNICGKRFIQSGTLRAHFRIHTGERPFSCKLCAKTFRQAKHVNLHMKTHTNGPKDPSLRRKRGPNKMQKDHNKKSERTAEDYPFQCDLCTKRFSTKPALKHHVTYHGEKKFLCSYCGKAFVNKNILDTHSTVHTGIKKFSCKICFKSFAYSSYLKTHMYVHTGEKPFECNVCQRRFSQLPHMNAHLRIHAGIKPYGCDVCGKHFSLSGNLRVHRRIHTGETPYICPVCNKGFYDSSSMKKHWRTHGQKITVKDETAFV